MSHYLRAKMKLVKWAGQIVRKLLNASDNRPYQSFLYGGSYLEGKVDTVRMYYSLGLSCFIQGKSVLDLGCNEGGICLLAAKDGAHPVVGVELQEKVYNRAVERSQEAKLEVKYVHSDVMAYLEKAEVFDVVMFLAMIRHVHGKLMKSKGYSLDESGRGYLVYHSFQTLILGQNNPVKKELDDFLKGCIAKARKYFICSINDHSGLILRRAEVTKKYFQGLTERCVGIDVFAPLPNTPEYTVIQMELSSQ